MRIAVIGSRNFENFDLMVETMHRIIYEENEGSFDNVTIVSGEAGGADSLAKRYATEFNLGYKGYKPNWKDLSHPDARIKVNQYGEKYDANAGFRRNTLIIEDCDFVVAFHNGSPGTADSIRKAKTMGKKVIEIKF